MVVASLLAGCAQSESAWLDASADGGDGADDASASSGRGAAHMDGGHARAGAASPPPVIDEDAAVRDGGSPTPADAGHDASMDAGMDGGADAGMDGGADASMDATADATVDADAASPPRSACEGLRLCSLEFLEGTDRLQPMAISADGSTVAGYAWASALEGLPAARHYWWRWTLAAGTTRLFYLDEAPGRPQFDVLPRAVSEDGSLVLGWSGGNGSVLWSAPEIANLLPLAQARDMSDDATVFVGGLGGPNAARYTEAEGILLIGHVEAPACGTPPCPSYAYASAVSGDGLVIVGDSNGKAFRWSQSQHTQAIPTAELGDEDDTADAVATNRDGSVIIGCIRDSTTQVRSMWRFTEAQGATDLGSLTGDPIVNCQAAINADGSLVVGVSNGHAFLWDAEHGMRELGAALSDSGIDVTGWVFENAAGVSGDGKTIVGRAKHLDQSVGFIARLP